MFDLTKPVDESPSPGRRAWQRFKRNRLGFWSLLVFCVLVGMSLLAEVISNDRPLLVRYQGEFYVPVLKNYSEKPLVVTSRQAPTIWIRLSASV